MSTYLLKTSEQPRGSAKSTWTGLGSDVLLYNAHWFIKVRWFVVALFTVFGVIGRLFPGFVSVVGFLPPRVWPWVLAVSLAVANVGFCLISTRLNESSSEKVVEAILWIQIIVDLLVVTALVYFTGSTMTVVPFAYLFHIVLACIFFPAFRSFMVTLMATSFYLACVGLELADILPTRSAILGEAGALQSVETAVFFVLSAVFIWFVVWYLVATLSGIVRRRTAELKAINHRLTLADEEKNRIVLRTTHDLKAPFSGIESAIQIIRMEYGDSLQDKLKELIRRIEVRSQTLSERIRDILLLGDLRTEKPTDDRENLVDLGRTFDDVRAELNSFAAEKNVRIEADLINVRIAGNARHFSILIANLLSNAITYSKKGGIVRVAMTKSNEGVHIIIQDEGIGITEDALPHIFDEYFRAKEAARWNPKSTGLGLAIVKEMAQREGLSICVTSEEGKGTRFDITVPVASKATRH